MNDEATPPGRPLSYLAGIPVDLVSGIGVKASRRLGEAGIHSVADLLLHAPRRYLDRSQVFDLSMVPLGEEVTVGGTVTKFEERRIRGGKKMIIATLSDGTNAIQVVWFNPYLKFSVGTELLLSGKVERFRGKLQMKSPDYHRLGAKESLVTGRLVPFHRAFAKFGPGKVREWVANALRRSRPIHEVLPAAMLARLGLQDRDTAIGAIHFPDTLEDAARARERLVFDEFFRLELALALRKHHQAVDEVGVSHVVGGELAASFVAALPYELTGAQHRAIRQIEQDLAGSHPMHRLLQGEVGSGKTVVAAAALLAAVQGGFQGAVMAPTEVLAEQHYLGLKDLLASAGVAPGFEEHPDSSGMESLFAAEGGSDGAVRIALLTANRALANFVEGEARRRDVLKWIEEGTIDLAVGTHSLIQDEVAFDKLGLAVVDEQHRFGVYQRLMLREKSNGYQPDMLIMTATPIPRTLAMTLYGDLDVSVLDEMPPGRLPVDTEHVDGHDVERVYAMVRDEVAAGRQAFVVCPLVEDSDKLEVTSATSEYERLRDVFPNLRVGLLHGQMRSSDKEAVMHGLRRGDIDVLVATTVIEVGIDVPNATLMIIEDAHRFGLSQLHQLRGRIGRGEHASRCILLGDPTTPEGEARIQAMVATTDGFRLAEEDLRIRGQGTVFGVRQAGMKDLKIADILADKDSLIQAREEAFDLVARDPDLSEHPGIADEIKEMMGEEVEWLFRS